MAKDKKRVEAITSMEEDFTKWYTDICLKAELVDYASVKGFMIMRPYGYAIWENMVDILDGMFKKTGHQNVAMPVLIPESLLQKEGELVNGFAPEVAWVTMGGSDKLEERLADVYKRQPNRYICWSTMKYLSWSRYISFQGSRLDTGL